VRSWPADAACLTRAEWVETVRDEVEALHRQLSRLPTRLQMPRPFGDAAADLLAALEGEAEEPEEPEEAEEAEEVDDECCPCESATWDDLFRLWHYVIAGVEFYRRPGMRCDGSHGCGRVMPPKPVSAMTAEECRDWLDARGLRYTHRVTREVWWGGLHAMEVAGECIAASRADSEPAVLRALVERVRETQDGEEVPGDEDAAE